MQKVIGLDIGSFSIKAVEIINSFKSYQIQNFYELEMDYREGVEKDVVLAECLDKLFRDNNLQADRILTAMPGQYISSRILPTTFSDPRKIGMAVLAEIEDAVPFNLDDMIVDHQILGAGLDGRTIVMVAMTRKTFLKSFLDHLSRVNIDPKIIDVDSLSFYNLAPYLRADPDECVAMVDIGHEKTSVCIVQGGILKMFRSINIGGSYLTDFLSRDLESTLMEAQAAKHRVSQVVCEADNCSRLSAPDRLVAERMTLACNAIVKDLGRTLYAFKTWDRTKISRIFLSGGSARIKNMDTYLAEQLGIPVVLNHLDATDLKISEALAEKALVMPQSVAIGLRSVATTKTHSQINLRKGEFSYVQNYAQIMKIGKIVAQVLGVAALLLMVSYGFRSFLYKGQMANLEKEYQREYSSIGLTKKKSAVNVEFQKFRTEARTAIQKEITSRKDAVDSFLASSGTSPALLALRDVSAAIPKTIKIDVTGFVFLGAVGAPGGKLTLKAETDKYESAEAIKEALKKSPAISAIEEKQQAAGKPGTENKIIEFSLLMTHKPAEFGKKG
jgi:type IV pilus assembly protein PilM